MNKKKTKRSKKVEYYTILRPTKDFIAEHEPEELDDYKNSYCADEIFEALWGGNNSAEEKNIKFDKFLIVVCDKEYSNWFKKKNLEENEENLLKYIDENYNPEREFAKLQRYHLNVDKRVGFIGVELITKKHFTKLDINLSEKTRKELEEYLWKIYEKDGNWTDVKVFPRLVKINHLKNNYFKYLNGEEYKNREIGSWNANFITMAIPILFTQKIDEAILPREILEEERWDVAREIQGEELAKKNIDVEDFRNSALQWKIIQEISKQVIMAEKVGIDSFITDADFAEHYFSMIKDFYKDGDKYRFENLYFE